MSTRASDKVRNSSRRAGGRHPECATVQDRSKRERTTNLVWAVVIIGLLAAIAVAVGKSLSSDDPGTVTANVVPANIEAGAFSVGDSDAPVTVDLHYDYMCPACGVFEATNVEDLTRLIEDGTVRVQLHVMSFLDEQSQGTEYSTRAGNAYAAVVNGAPDRVWDFHSALYANQPAEGTGGLSDSQIAVIATGVGVPADVVDTFTDGTYHGWVATSTQDAFDAGVRSTPTVTINGAEFTGNWAAPGELATAIEAEARA